MSLQESPSQQPSPDEFAVIRESRLSLRLDAAPGADSFPNNEQDQETIPHQLQFKQEHVHDARHIHGRRSAKNAGDPDDTSRHRRFEMVQLSLSFRYAGRTGADREAQ